MFSSIVKVSIRYITTKRLTLTPTVVSTKLSTVELRIHRLHFYLRKLHLIHQRGMPTLLPGFQAYAIPLAALSSTSIFQRKLLLYILCGIPTLFSFKHLLPQVFQLTHYISTVFPTYLLPNTLQTRPRQTNSHDVSLATHLPSRGQQLISLPHVRLSLSRVYYDTTYQSLPIAPTILYLPRTRPSNIYYVPKICYHITNRRGSATISGSRR